MIAKEINCGIESSVSNSEKRKVNLSKGKEQNSKMVTGIFESHAHYDDPRFDEDRETRLEEIFAGGVDTIMNIGADIETSRNALALAEKYPNIYCSVGVHPSDAPTVQSDYLDVLREMAKSPRVRAIGEIGLDYHYEGDNEAAQKRVFEEQLQLALELDKPVIIHDRDAHADCMELLRKYQPRGVVHCFSGSAEMAKELIKMGFYIGFTGVVTFKNARRALEAVAVVPLDRLLVETDCPYMAPEPYRGTRCDSLMLKEIIAKIAQIKGVAPQEIAEKTAQNARKIFEIA